MSETQMIESRAETDQVAMTLGGVKRQIQLIQQIMKNEMENGVHYGTIPGCGDKPALLKAGAEKLNLTFRMAPKFDITITSMGDGHREYAIKTSLYHIDTGKFLGEGLGSCSTMESKYRYRDDKRKCPKCASTAIIKGKEEYGGGWICFVKKGGCGVKFPDNAPEILEQKVGKIENPDVADVYNTVLKMAKKRSHVDATLSATAASDIFTQDIEENAEPEAAPTPVKTPMPKGTAPTPVNGNTVLLFGEHSFFLKQMEKLGADLEEVKRFAKDKFGTEDLTKLTKDQAKKIISTWNPEPPAAA